LGSEPDTGFTAVRGNSIVEQADDPVDVFVDRDRQQAFVRGDSRLRRRESAAAVQAVADALQVGQRLSALAQLTVGVRGVPLLLDAGHPALLHDDP
jgi:hypothetical protein